MNSNNTSKEPITVQRERLEIVNSFGRVYKHELKRQLGCRTRNEWTVTIKWLSKNDPEFEKEYPFYHGKWYITERLAVKIVSHLYPEYEVAIKLEGQSLAHSK